MENFKTSRSAKGIYEFVHKSGLKLLLVPQNGLKVTTANITYHVGSRNEGLGVRGATHYLEHGMFKGSKNFNKKLKNGMWKLEEFGAYMNATTYTDRTNYFAVIDSDKLDEVIMREADRMFQPLLEANELKKEMTVVRNEFERGENNDFEVLQKRVMATAFMAHPYHHSTIGWKSEIENVTAEALKNFHDTFYKPHNATYTFVGNFDVEKVMKMVNDEFSKFKEHDPSIPKMYTTEPLQMGQRRVTMQRPTNCALMCVSFKAPNGLHEDAIALEVIANMISKGPKALSQSFKKDDSLPVHDIIAEWERMRDPYLFSIWGTTNSPTKSALQQTEKCIENIVSMFENPSSMKDLMESSKRNIKNGWDNEMLGTRNTAMAINEAIARGDAFDVYRRYELLEQVDLKQIQRVAKKYFDFRQSTVGWLWPGEVPHEIKPSSYEPLKTQPFVLSSLKQSETPNFTASNDVFTKYENGKADVLISVQGSASVKNYIANYLLSQLMTKGFKIQSKVCTEDKLYEYLQDKNIQRAMSASVDSLHVQASIPVVSLTSAIGLLMKELQNPILDKSTFEYLKKKWCSELYGAKNNVNHVAKLALNQALFQRSDPNYRYSFDEVVEELNRMDYETLKQCHASLLEGPRLVTLVSPKEHKISNKDEWKREVANQLMIQGKPNDIKIPGKSSVVLRYGMVVEYSDALKLAVAVLGNGFTGRLMRIVRDECGYTYGINASLVPMKGCAVFQITGTFSPALLQNGMEKTEEVIKDWLKDTLTEEEVRVQKSETIGSKNVQFDTPGALASAIHHTKLMYGSVDRINNYAKLIGDITLDEINKAKSLISFEKLSKVRVGTF